MLVATPSRRRCQTARAHEPACRAPASPPSRQHCTRAKRCHVSWLAMQLPPPRLAQAAHHDHCSSPIHGLPPRPLLRRPPPRPPLCSPHYYRLRRPLKCCRPQPHFCGIRSCPSRPALTASLSNARWAMHPELLTRPLHAGCRRHHHCEAASPVVHPPPSPPLAGDAASASAPYSLAREACGEGGQLRYHPPHAPRRV